MSKIVERHAFFSAESAAKNGVGVYRGVSGKLAPITVVTETQEHGTGWKDMRYLGRVTEWVGRIECGATISKSSRDGDQRVPNHNVESLHEGLRRMGATDMRGLPDVKGKKDATAVDKAVLAEAMKHIFERYGKKYGEKSG